MWSPKRELGQVSMYKANKMAVWQTSNIEKLNLWIQCFNSVIAFPVRVKETNIGFQYLNFFQ
jgi:hypothetical protein